MNTKEIGIYSKIKVKIKKQNNSKEINYQSKKLQSNISLIVKFPIQHKTTKHSPETRDLTENTMKNIKQTQFKQKQQSTTIFNNQKNNILLKKKITNIVPISTINLTKGNQKKTKGKEKQSIVVLKYIDNITRKPMPKPFTSSNTRKTSNEKSDKKKSNKESKVSSHQSSSIGKLRKNCYVNTSELRNLLSQYSIISRLSSHSNTKKKTNSKNKSENSNLTDKNIRSNKNNAVWYPSQSKNSHNVTKNSTTDKKNKIFKKGNINQINKRKCPTIQGTIAYNSVNKQLKYPKPITMQINQPYLYTITPTQLQTNKNVNISTNPNKKNSGTVSLIGIERRNLSNNKQKQKSTVEEMIKQFTYYKLLKQSIIGHLTSSNSISKNNKIKKRSSSNNDYPKIRDNSYYSKESINLSKYIQEYYSNHLFEYPSTSLKFYKIGRLIGHGAFGKVNICLHVLTGRIIAIKSFNKSKHLLSKKKIQYEIKLMKRLKSHKNIIKVYEEIESEKYHCIVMEYINGGSLLSLNNKRGKLTEDTAYFIFRQLIEALSFIHSQGIVHRDIKPDNILIDLNNNIKICDFGIGKEIEHGDLIQDSCGTPAFTAPELYKDEPYDPYKSDIWSCGVVLYSMVSDSFPFRGNNDYELHQSILSGKYHEINHLSPSCSNLLHQLLEVNPTERISIEKIMGHPWMTKHLNHQKADQIQLFTNAEKIIYSKISIDYRKGKKEDLIEAFTYRNIDTNFENENKNKKTKSFIFTPPNSIIINLDDEDLYYSDLRIENKTMKFSPDINNLNQNYEINFNEDADQGQFIHRGVNHVKRQMISLHNSNEKIIKESHSNNTIVNQVTNNDHSTNDICNNKKKKIKDSLMTNYNTYYIDENILKLVEEYGYKREYVIKSLESNELNHSSATYFILLNALTLSNNE